MTEYEDDIKQIAWESYWEGYKQGRGVESYTKDNRKTAIINFERFWKRNT